MAGICVSFSVAGAEDRSSGPVPNVLGDSGKDLVFTPVAPCRAIDTRAAGGRLTAGVSRDFDVAGTLSGQGGVADCLIPFGPATAVVINIVAVDPLGAGNLAAWTFGGAVPTASVINYRAGVNIANGLVLPICNPAGGSCAHDLTIQANVSDAHLVADVAGYFSGVTSLTVPWANVTGKPAGFADNIDNDTQYSAAAAGGLTLAGTQFSVATGGVNSAMILDGTIGNADVGASAAIAASKVAGTAAVLSFTGTEAFDTSTLVIDATSNSVGFGTTTPLSPLAVATSTEPLTASAQIGHGSGVRGLVLKRTANDTGYTNLTLLKSRGDVVTPAQGGDGVGQVLFNVVDGASSIRSAAEVRVDLNVLTTTDLETSMSFEVHDGTPSSALVERLRVTPSGITVTGAADATTVSATSVSTTANVTAGGDVIAGGGVFTGVIPPPGAVAGAGSALSYFIDSGCTSANRGEIRVFTLFTNYDALCACLRTGDTLSHNWICFTS
jgi:hypothetical protein